MGYACDPFEADAALRILGDVRHQVAPIISTPWQEIPALYARLGDGAVADCLRFMILTAMRTEACAGARQDEVAGDTWTVGHAGAARSAVVAGMSRSAWR